MNWQCVFVDLCQSLLCQCAYIVWILYILWILLYQTGLMNWQCVAVDLFVLRQCGLCIIYIFYGYCIFYGGGRERERERERDMHCTWKFLL